MNYIVPNIDGHSSVPLEAAAQSSIGQGSVGPCRAVVLISPAWPPAVVANGIVTTVAAAKKGLEALDVRCSILSISRAFRGDDRPNNVFHVASFDRPTWITRFPRKIANRLGQAAARLSFGPRRASTLEIPGFERAIAYIEERNGIDVIEVEESFGLPGYVSRHSRLPVVARLHGPWFLTGAANGAEPNDAFRNRVQAEGSGIVNANSVSSPSHFVLRAVEERYEAKLPTCAVIPNAVEPACESAIWHPRTADPNHVLFVGRFDKHKGADLCLRAFVKVLEKRPKAQLTFVGPDRGVIDEETNRTHSAEEWLGEEIQSPQIRSRINLRGQLSRADIIALRRRAAVTLVPSRFENFPMTVLESMAQGCPLVASRVGGIPEVIEHEKNGLLCVAEDADDLAAKILCVLENRQLAANLGKNALHDSLVRYSPRVVAQQNLEFYNEVCARCTAGESTYI